MVTSQEIAKIFRGGYLTMEENGQWLWWKRKPWIENNGWCSKYKDGSFECIVKHAFVLNDLIDIQPVDDWTKSLVKCGR